MTFPLTENRTGGPSCTGSAAGATAPQLAGATPRSGHFSDLAESVTNAVLGLVISWAATRFVLGYSPIESAAITAMFFGLSFARSFVVRRVFRGLSNV